MPDGADAEAELGGELVVRFALDHACEDGELAGRESFAARGGARCGICAIFTDLGRHVDADDVLEDLKELFCLEGALGFGESFVEADGDPATCIAEVVDSGLEVAAG